MFKMFKSCQKNAQNAQFNAKQRKIKGAVRLNFRSLNFRSLSCTSLDHLVLNLVPSLREKRRKMKNERHPFLFSFLIFCS